MKYDIEVTIEGKQAIGKTLVGNVVKEKLREMGFSVWLQEEGWRVKPVQVVTVQDGKTALIKEIQT